MKSRTKVGFPRTSLRPPAIFFGLVLVLAACDAVRSGISGLAPPPPAVTPVPDTFTAAVRPILAARCAPCHEPGGKLYEKLPFDDREVVAGHATGILKRLRGADRDVVEKWLASLRPPSLPGGGRGPG